MTQNDFMMWLIEAAPPGFYQTPLGIANKIMATNFAAIHTSSLVGFFDFTISSSIRYYNINALQTFTHALLQLAAHPDWVKPLRTEVEGIIGDEGWTKASMQKMKKIDSFMRESSRVNTLGLGKTVPL